ncbi:hypothetical protein CLAIMM_01811 [Cladophialophora immunda]|nr:hypothetical protein CLAIMM_01811 [Cladophialophora immunda]
MGLRQVAFVSGAARGIGKAIALRLARDGFNVAVNDIKKNITALEATAAEIRALGRESSVTPADVSKRTEVTEAFEKSARDLGQLNVLVANAGVCKIKPLVDVSTEEWEDEMAINLTGMFHQFQLAARQMIRQGTGGKIIAAASMVAHKSVPLMGGYSASKWGVRGLSQAAAQELAPYGISVNNYCPGMVDTPMWASVDGALRKYYGGEPGEHKRKFESSILVGRLSQPDDIAKFVSYLASKDCDYITGQSMLIDGGCYLT